MEKQSKPRLPGGEARGRRVGASRGGRFLRASGSSDDCNLFGRIEFSFYHGAHESPATARARFSSSKFSPISGEKKAGFSRWLDLFFVFGKEKCFRHNRRKFRNSARKKDVLNISNGFVLSTGRSLVVCGQFSPNFSCQSARTSIGW